ncbi:UDP-N-acetylglucosamine 4,6-dehydratase (inverting) [Chloroflexota bacterium]
MNLDNKVILLTGGTGSFGQKFTEIVLAEHNPKAIRIFSRGELLQEEMRNKFNNDSRLRFVIGDIRDRERVHRVMNNIDIVVHAAALKQVPSCEYNPIEAVRTNIDGAVNIIDAAVDGGVSRVFAISTDKAVNPVNLYGATKLVMERIITQANVYGAGKTLFSCSRYGNVIGSRGSVIPLFLKQKDTGMITITDERMTRFWITLERGTRFVIDSIDRMQGGDIFIPKAPSMNIMELADEIAPESKKKIVGIRPGEKLHETLLTDEETLHTWEFDDYFVIVPEFPYWGEKDYKGGQPLPAGFRYTSDGNKQWMSKGKIKEIIEELKWTD